MWVWDFEHSTRWVGIDGWVTFVPDRLVLIVELKLVKKRLHLHVSIGPLSLNFGVYWGWMARWVWRRRNANVEANGSRSSDCA